MNIHDEPHAPGGREGKPEAQVELERCLGRLLHLFPDPDFQAHPPMIVLDTGPVPLVEHMETDADITLHTRRDLNRSPEEILTILLHKAIHSYNAFRWQRDCTAVNYHTRGFRRQAEQVGFQVAWAGRRSGWARTVPTAHLRDLFEQVALDEDTLVPFRREVRFRGLHRWHCGRRRFPSRAELATRLARRCPADSRRLVRTLRVHRRRDSPVVRLTGHWLKPFGFGEGTALKVEVSYGLMTIQARTLGEER